MTGPIRHQARPGPTLPQRSLSREVVRLAREIGPRIVAEKSISKFTDYMFDLKHRTDTCRCMSLSDTRVSKSELQHGYFYVATGVLEFRKLMKALQLPRSGTFIDFGCGKGRVVLMAAAYGFHHVIGVELAEELCSVAKRNVENYRGYLPENVSIDIIHANAATFSVPDDATVFFLLNPFDDTVIRHVLQGIGESLRRSDRPIYLIYGNSTHANTVAHDQLFTFAEQYDFPRARFIVYVAGTEPTQNI